MNNTIEQSVISTSDYHFNLKNEVFAQLEMQSRQRLYSKRPDIWARDMLGVTFWSRQVEIALAVVSHKDVMVAAGHGVGKTMMTAVLMLWWTDIHHSIGKESIALSTAPSTSQVRIGIWREMKRFLQASSNRHDEYLRRVRNKESLQGFAGHKLPGRIVDHSTWKDDDGTILAIGRTPPRGREGDSFQGVHGNVFAVIDEAVGVSEDMIQTMANNTSTSSDRRLLIANPTNPASAMGRIWHDSESQKLWKRISISVFDSPKFTDEWKELPQDTLASMTDESFVEGKKLEYGEDSANYRARVLGQWATEDDMLLFTEDVLGLGRDVVVMPDTEDTSYVGFDVSRSIKGDYSYLYLVEEGWVYDTQEYDSKEDDWVDLEKPRKTERRGIRIRFLDKWRGMPFQTIHNKNGQVVEEGANKLVHAHMKATGAKQLRIDVGGMGVNMLDAMYDIYGEEYDLVEIDGGTLPPTGTRKGFYNLRAYGYSELARRMREGTVDIDPGDNILIDQLGSIQYKFAAGYADSMLIEAKEDMRRKGLKSPDAADAAWMGSTMIDIDSLHSADSGQFEVDFAPIVDEFAHFYASSSW